MARHPRITLAVETIGGFDDGELTITAAETYIAVSLFSRSIIN
jgi:hypothetical protein